MFQMFRDRTLDPVSVRTLYNHVREGRYDSVSHPTFSQQVRIEVVKIIESTPVEPTMDRGKHVERGVPEGEPILLGDTKELYRGYNFPSDAELEKFLADPSPFSAVHLEGPLKGQSKNPDSLLTITETYLGLYVTLEKAKAEGYTKWSGTGSSALITFSWPVIRAMYVCGLLDFTTSNDVAYETEDFQDEEGMERVATEVADHLPESMPDEIYAAIVGPRADDLFEESRDELIDRVQDMPSSIIWAALYGRNREIALEDNLGWEVGFDWKSPFGDAVIVKIDARRGTGAAIART
ncbi:MAG TPA: hypothetical protein DCW74_18990 [Alteromonas australica]|uniref:Uncharacterized protein n=1 Tax=Alteromonas australica TaxID=589873 RepID=A0A350P940_9ALTE|nr:hypothetical protein [Alteromonas australica]